MSITTYTVTGSANISTLLHTVGDTSYGDGRLLSGLITVITCRSRPLCWSSSLESPLVAPTSTVVVPLVTSQRAPTKTPVTTTSASGTLRLTGFIETVGRLGSTGSRVREVGKGGIGHTSSDARFTCVAHGSILIE